MHHLKRRRLAQEPGRYIPEILAGQLISIIGGLLAGGLLGYFRQSFEPVIGFLILFPGVVDGLGNLQGSLAARLNHTVLRWPTIANQPQAWQNNRLATYSTSLLLGLSLGLVAIIMTYLIDGSIRFNLFWIALMSSLLASLLLTPLISWLTDYLADHGHDPDNTMGPIVTSLADIIGVIMLAVAIFFFG